MKTQKKNIMLVVLLFIFFTMFRFSNLIHSSVIESVDLFVTNLVPSMFPMFLMIDLLLNYGLAEKLYNVFKNNSIILILLSLLSGTPSNAKYIKEFYEDGYISKDMANLLLSFSYSPNPLFVMAFFPTMKPALFLLSYIYITNLIIFVIMKPRFKNLRSSPKEYKSLPFITCLTNSINKSAHVLILILGVVVTFGILNSIIRIFNPSSMFIYSILEISNAFKMITETQAGIFWMTFAASFGGLSIHAQIKSILESTDLSYRYFLMGRILASLPILIMAFIF